MRRRKFPRIIIAGTKGGSGKTMVSLGLITVLRGKSLSVVPFKKGPDYIDAGWLSFAAGVPCYNLDPFLMSEGAILSSFRDHFSDADIAVIEGNRGLYDGMDAEGSCSTAQLSKMLAAPVIVVLDCTKVTRTAGAFLLGMQKFDRRVRIAGVVLNQIAGVRHEKLIREVIGKTCKIPVVGAIPRLPGGFLSERHMGLTPFQEHPDVEKSVSYAGEIARKYVDIDEVKKIAASASALARGVEALRALNEDGRGLKIGIIKDSAFQFYYPDNFEALLARGAELVEIDAMDANDLPGIDALYIGGGFPETHAIALAENASFRRSLKREVDKGLPIYAECGGLMYLGRAIVTGGKSYPMANIFPLRFSLEKKPAAHGYTVVKVAAANPFYRKGTLLRGHEFHYSRALDGSLREGMSYSFAMRRGKGVTQKLDGLSYRNVLATYTHIHALGTPEWADGMIRQAHAHRKRRAGNG